MIQRIKEILEYAATHGLNLPAAYDARVGHGSVSLLFAHVSFFLTIIGIAFLMTKDLYTGVYCAMGYSALMLTFYLIRSIGKMKFSKDGIELEDDDEEEKDGK